VGFTTPEQDAFVGCSSSGASANLLDVNCCVCVLLIALYHCRYLLTLCNGGDTCMNECVLLVG
jgi:hypothetical protein